MDSLAPRSRLPRFGAASLVVALCLVGDPPARADTAQDEALPADPRDLSGVWMNDDTLDERLKREGRKRLDPDEPERPPTVIGPELLTDEYLAVYEEMRRRQAEMEEGTRACSWPGMPNILTYPYPFEILHTPGRVTLIYEAESQVRRIFLDRAEHLPYDELDPSYNGDSIGRWEGDTLVIDTIGFTTDTTMWGRLPHSEEMQIVERIRYVDGDTIHNDVTITDPAALKEPVSRTVVYSKRPGWRIREYSCMENNRDAPDVEGKRSGGVVDN